MPGQAGRPVGANRACARVVVFVRACCAWNTNFAPWSLLTVHVTLVLFLTRVIGGVAVPAVLQGEK